MVLGIFFLPGRAAMEMGMDFLRQMEAGFCSCGLSCRDVLAPGKTVGLGVSGGADSMALLHGVFLLRKSLFGEGGADLLVVSVNHNIRPPQESAADAAFVSDFCSRLQGVECRVVELPPGLVVETARKRGRGVEEAARFLRYGAFQREAAAAGCQFFLLAHTRNDQLETLLLRFLQGSGDGSGQGIPPARDMFLRPLLNVSRQDIEEFLAHCQVEFRTDRTNLENGHLRNRCRNLLVPLLDREFPGWQKSVLTGSEKRRDDNDFISSVVPKDLWQEEAGESLLVPWDRFLSLHPALRRRVLFQGLNRLGVDSRIPYHLVGSLACREGILPPGRLFSFGPVQVESTKEGLLVKRSGPGPDSSGFSLVIDSGGEYSLPMGTLLVAEDKARGENPAWGRRLLVGGMSLSPPLVVRSPEPGDRAVVKGRIQSVSEIFSGRREQGDLYVAVVEELGGETVGLLPASSLVGFGNEK